jgi:cyclophilin family peptidyl-prolyl cis-trans isomerase
MKKILLLLALTTTLHADEVALLEIKFADGTTRRAAIEFYPSDAPATVENFKKLARKGFYNKCAFHRAIAGAIVQTGDPLSKKKSRNAVGTGGPGYTLPAEIHRRHTKGAVAAARLADKVNLQRRSNGSQFYVCISPQSQLDGKYTVFGNVIQGFDVLEMISNKPTDTNDYPTERIILRKVTIIPREKLPQPAAPAKTGSPETARPPFWRRIWPW